MTKEIKTKKLKELYIKMKADKTLPLQEEAANLVFGTGNPAAEIMFIGEGPGYWEDQKGEPFVGNAGKFLDQLLHSIKLPRESVFITNVVNYRPPENRDPLPEEIAAFGPYIDEMIDIIKPKIIVTLGRFSMAKFIPGVRISDVHGKKKLIDWKKRKITIIPMYHPAAGLRNGEVKRRTIDDFGKIPDILTEVEQTEVVQTEVEQMELI
ncbi:uracil-DNA glycosylase [Patescibacteria group bacterium]|nr:uracil-DNA glycosylase [Patescibacteria group bacterium]MBU0776771.1 uracil-DNA glycosylase [Patescibacteria group bacterium]MBU0846344.1 uracil-DNA glycosylase [Patescibacteria group bacterium]MBU0922696.1 uracil-DNA glycosylase [Patescibacteria group bacterium]MBU1066747.1 uracil-DNA glycosylase [Patescibacteria group bacterium]